jgi:hypothetical protein
MGSQEDLREFGALLRCVRGRESLEHLAGAVMSSKSVLSRAERGERVLDLLWATRLDEHFGLNGALEVECHRLLHGVAGPHRPNLSTDAEKMRILANVIGTGPPARITKFGSRALIEVHFCRDRVAADRSEIRILIATQAGYPQPGDNYAGVDIAPILHTLDLSRYTHATLD